jgi:hypothetical protein
MNFIYGHGLDSMLRKHRLKTFTQNVLWRNDSELPYTKKPPRFFHIG